MNGKLVGGVALAAGICAVAALATSEKRKPVPQPPQGQLLDIDGAEVFVIERGEGPAMVLIHGFGASTFAFRSLMEPVSRTNRVVALDLPGFGWSDRDPTIPLDHDSQADRVVRVMDELGIDTAVIIGHSMGGGIGQRLAVRHPARVTALVLISSVDASDRERWQRGQQRANRVIPMVAIGARLAPFFVRAGMRRGLRGMVGDPSIVDDAMVAGYTVPLTRKGTGRCMEAMFRAVLEQEPCDVGAIAAPTLVIGGELDSVIKPRVAAKLAREIPGATLVSVERLGHMGPEEMPARILDEIQAFVTANALVRT